MQAACSAVSACVVEIAVAAGVLHSSTDIAAVAQLTPSSELSKLASNTYKKLCGECCYEHHNFVTQSLLLQSPEAIVPPPTLGCTQHAVAAAAAAVTAAAMTAETATPVTAAPTADAAASTLISVSVFSERGSCRMTALELPSTVSLYCITYCPLLIIQLQL
eukprot:17931-Heterococcus_DN1.PRE.2